MNIEVERHRGSRIPRRWLVLIPVLVAAGAVALLFQQPNATAPESTGEVVLFKNVPLDEQVPGFTDTLVAVIGVRRLSAYINWEATERAGEFALLEHRGMQLNADGTGVATLRAGGATAGDLIVGRPGEERAIAPDASGFAWHDENPRLLAATRNLATTSLWMVELDEDFGFQILQGVPVAEDSVVVAYGAWGYALHTPPDSDGVISTIVLDADGISVDEITGTVVATQPGEDGGVLVADPFSSRVTASWSDGPSTGDVVDAGPVLAAMWSPDLGSFAQLSDGEEPGIDRLIVRHAEGRVTERENYQPLAWDSTGRFLAALVALQLVVIDAETGDEYELSISQGPVSDLAFYG